MKNSRIWKNTFWLMLFQVAKIAFPFLTLPYLTRVLTVDSYGVVSYVKNIMNYMQIFVDFGFVLSATKDIVKCIDNKKDIEYIIGDTMIARIFLGIIGFFIVIVLALFLPILSNNFLFTILSYVVIFESIFLMDFLFRGLQKMHIIAIRFIVMKTISTVLTFVLIKNNDMLLLIPILDIISSTIAVFLVFLEIKKLDYNFKFTSLKKGISALCESFIYFLSSIASTSFNAFSTIVIGVILTSTEVAYWSVCMQIIGSITACYNPIADSLYPEMIKNKNFSLIEKALKIFMPIIIIGCIISYFFADTGLYILGGEKYVSATPVFILLIPVLFFGFLSVLFGWPTLGAIDKAKDVTKSTVTSTILHILILMFLIFTNRFTLINIAIARTLTEVILFTIRFANYHRYKNLFNYNV